MATNTGLTSQVRHALVKLGHAGAAVYSWQELPDGSLKIQVAGSVEALVWYPALVDDLTAIPGVGDKAAAKLAEAGLLTFEDLKAADYGLLIDTVGKASAAKVTAHFGDVLF